MPARIHAAHNSAAETFAEYANQLDQIETFMRTISPTWNRDDTVRLTREAIAMGIAANAAPRSPGDELTNQLRKLRDVALHQLVRIQFKNDVLRYRVPKLHKDEVKKGLLKSIALARRGYARAALEYNEKLEALSNDGVPVDPESGIAFKKIPDEHSLREQGSLRAFLDITAPRVEAVADALASASAGGEVDLASARVALRVVTWRVLSKMVRCYEQFGKDYTDLECAVRYCDSELVKLRGLGVRLEDFMATLRDTPTRIIQIGSANILAGVWLQSSAIGWRAIIQDRVDRVGQLRSEFVVVSKAILCVPDIPDPRVSIVRAANNMGEDQEPTVLAWSTVISAATAAAASVAVSAVATASAVSDTAAAAPGEASQRAESSSHAVTSRGRSINAPSRLISSI